MSEENDNKPAPEQPTPDASVEGASAPAERAAEPAAAVPEPTAAPEASPPAQEAAPVPASETAPPAAEAPPTPVAAPTAEGSPPAEGAPRKETDEEKAARRKAAFEAKQAAKAAAAQAAAEAAKAAQQANAAAPADAPAAPAAPAEGAASAAEPAAPPPPQSPSQPRLNRAVTLLKELVAEDAVEEAYINEPNDHLPTLVVKNERWAQAASLFRNHTEFACNYLRNVSGVDYETYMEVVYYPWNMERKEGYCVKVRADREAPSVASVTPIWETANWNEREIYDLLGIDFPGHPDLRRIMMPDDWEGHPLRKDYVPLDPEV